MDARDFACCGSGVGALALTPQGEFWLGPVLIAGKNHGHPLAALFQKNKRDVKLSHLFFNDIQYFRLVLDQVLSCHEFDQLLVVIHIDPQLPYPAHQFQYSHLVNEFD